MERHFVVLSNPVGKKHSVKYVSKEENSPITALYLMRTAIKPGKVPDKIKVTIEEEV
ncbi:MAG: hypothetical protein BWY21_01616 [Parcubacteria group bacterium ADurb.Bin216]|jgi:hypothetical protein|nr:MAG: hypothetical protein BWY21_01616 [Parcubacteria group bacterium ADurb.Bin216]